MKTQYSLLILLVVAALLLVACGSATTFPTINSSLAGEGAPAINEELSVQEPALKADDGVAVPQSADVAALPAPTMVAYEVSNQSGENIVVQNTNRKIIKNADVRLLVKDTSVAVNRSTQIVSDLGGYIVSSRIWYQDYYGNNLMYATITIGIPVDEFERALTRFRDLSIRVLDETASGEDVTDQYVDLQSELTNLEATRDRVKSFLDDAQNVDEALLINQQLSDIEAQIEQIKGRMNYISDRSAFSTITVNFEPDLPILTPTPTPTIAPTNTPAPTATLAPWKPGETFGDAKNTVTVAYQGIADFLIWLFVVILPVILPPTLILWALWKLFNRKPNKPSGGEK